MSRGTVILVGCCKMPLSRNDGSRCVSMTWRQIFPGPTLESLPVTKTTEAAHEEAAAGAAGEAPSSGACAAIVTFVSERFHLFCLAGGRRCAPPRTPGPTASTAECAMGQALISRAARASTSEERHAVSARQRCPTSWKPRNPETASPHTRCTLRGNFTLVRQIHESHPGCQIGRSTQMSRK